jgi:hypothetical protein
MTRRDQIVRSWIERESPRHHWKSCVSYRGKTHKKSTNSKIRKAAIQFISLHLINLLTQTAATPTDSTEQLVQRNLFH